MKILGIDTTTKFLCLGIYGDNRIYQYNIESGRRLSGLITLTIKRVLDAIGWKIGDIEYFACGLGPGSFTGMRVGIAAIKGLAFSLNKPVVGISTLDILARNAGDSWEHIIPVIDARRNLIYCSVYKNKNGKPSRIKPYMLVALDELFRMVKIKGKTAMLGDALNLYKQKILMNMKDITLLDKDYWYPNSRNIIDLAIERIKAKEVDSAVAVKPIYLYPKECQVKNIKL